MIKIVPTISNTRSAAWVEQLAFCFKMQGISRIRAETADVDPQQSQLESHERDSSDVRNGGSINRDI